MAMEGKVVVITGSAFGIGRAIALQAGVAGALAVVVADLPSEEKGGMQVGCWRQPEAVVVQYCLRRDTRQTCTRAIDMRYVRAVVCRRLRMPLLRAQGRTVNTLAAMSVTGSR